MKVDWQDAVIISSLAADAIEISKESSIVSFQLSARRPKCKAGIDNG
jgi:hypothetical protein